MALVAILLVDVYSAPVREFVRRAADDKVID